MMKVFTATCAVALLGLAACSATGGSTSPTVGPVAFCQPGICEGSTGAAGSLPTQIGEMIR
jgi:hypothetical protein